MARVHQVQRGSHRAVDRGDERGRVGGRGGPGASGGGETGPDAGHERDPEQLPARQPGSELGDELGGELGGVHRAILPVPAARARGGRPWLASVPCPSTRRSSRTTPACSTSATATRSTGRCAGNPGGQAGRVPARRARRRHARPSTAGCSTRSGTGSCCFDQRNCGRSTPQRERSRDRSERQHDLEPGGRPRAAARAPGHRPLAGVRRLVGLGAGPRLRRDAPGAGDRAGAARHLHPAPAASSTGSTRAARHTCPPTSGRGSWRRCRPSSAVRRVHRAPTRACSPTPTRPCTAPAAVAWSTWEAVDDHAAAASRARRASSPSPAYALAFARIENHYFVHGGWFEPEQLIRDADRLAAHPDRDRAGPLRHVHPGRRPPGTCTGRCPTRDFVLVDDAGHAFDEPGILDALITATDRFAG